MNTYSTTAVQNFIDTYINRGGEITTIREGILGHGTILLSAPGLRFSIINEIYLNEWASTHTVRQYKKLPKKYASA